MNIETKLIYHFTNFGEFEFICLENKGLDFHELEHIMYEYGLNQPEKSLEFKECWIHHEYKEYEKPIRTVQVTFQDNTLNKIVRIWGAKKFNSGEVLKITIDLLNLETKELEYEQVLIG
ncbi:hypothetical protein [Rummeliibacillus stabekisii]|uniref:hypothetical protein n=1 Tax=Rummeliibacillus stabekisii TaxID=241244 RepID=UPI00116B15DE|nr:hypothetical protein [Rummeliibacillus stabekisii]MBB5171602.1 hypothetical protein [Rummeliibacillus stabekisii]GEL05449.1 hypothetical protein RST01_20760 [Rummeliibacillus stabekisii]